MISLSSAGGEAAASFAPQVARVDGSFEVRAGKRALMAAPGVAVHVPSAALAEAIAAEWREAGPSARTSALPLGRLAAAVHEVSEDRAATETLVSAYADTDLVCYWSDETASAALHGRQAAAWQPLLDWAQRALGAHLRVARGILPVAQDEAALRAIRAAVQAADVAELVALRVAAAASGSIIIALALLRGVLDVDHAAAAGTVDERFQMERWGVDSEAEAALAARRADLESAVRFLKLWRSS